MTPIEDVRRVGDDLDYVWRSGAIVRRPYTPDAYLRHLRACLRYHTAQMARHRHLAHRQCLELRGGADG